MSRCKICGCDLGPGIRAHHSYSCVIPNPICELCGEEVKGVELWRCGLCQHDMCFDCFESHIDECMSDNGQFGVGA